MLPWCSQTHQLIEKWYSFSLRRLQCPGSRCIQELNHAGFELTDGWRSSSPFLSLSPMLSFLPFLFSLSIFPFKTVLGDTSFRACVLEKRCNKKSQTFAIKILCQRVQKVKKNKNKTTSAHSQDTQQRQKSEIFNVTTPSRCPGAAECSSLPAAASESTFQGFHCFMDSFLPLFYI